MIDIALFLLAFLLVYLLYAAVLTVVVLVLFLALMNLADVRQRVGLHWSMEAVGMVLLYGVGYPLDCLHTITVGTVMFAEVPRELTLSARIQRLAAGKDGWRKTEAKWLSQHWLGPFDPSTRHSF
jgi:hypothetical protein